MLTSCNFDYIKAKDGHPNMMRMQKRRRMHQQGGVLLEFEPEELAQFLAKQAQGFQAHACPVCEQCPKCNERSPHPCPKCNCPHVPLRTTGHSVILPYAPPPILPAPVIVRPPPIGAVPPNYEQHRSFPDYQQQPSFPMPFFHYHPSVMQPPVMQLQSTPAAIDLSRPETLIEPPPIRAPQPPAPRQPPRPPVQPPRPPVQDKRGFVVRPGDLQDMISKLKPPKPLNIYEPPELAE